MKFNSIDYTYPSIRNLTYASNGMVCCSQPLAAQAGLDVLRKGGNAVDAILAAATCLTVMEPNSNGLGSDCFALVWKEGKLYGLNGSGQSPVLVTKQEADRRNFSSIPKRDWLPVMVPGAPGAWAALSRRFGRRTLTEDMEAAIDYAENGYPVSPVIADQWQVAARDMENYKDKPEFAGWFDTFSDNGRAPEEGELWTLKDHAKSLREIGDTYAENFYKGALAEKIDAFSRQTGGYIRKEDLAAYEPMWVDPVKVTYKGYEVWEMPPNGHGIVVQMALNLMENLKAESHDDAQTIHRQLECMKLAYADAQRYIADPRYMTVSVDDLLSKEYAKKRSALVGEEARLPEYGDPRCGGTVYLCAADKDGMMVSFIQSGYNDFGSGIVVPGTGINLNDRGCNFSLDIESPNCIGPAKRSYHTIIPGFLTKDGKAVGPFGVMGAFMQPQGQMQVVMNMIDFHMNPQQALNAPRWQWIKDNEIEIESGFPAELADQLRAKGHIVTIPKDSFAMGRGQIIIRDDHGSLVGATEPRADGCVAAW